MKQVISGAGLLLSTRALQYAFVALLLMNVAVAGTDVTTWRYSWLTAIDHVGVAVLYVGPVAAGVVAWRTSTAFHVMGESLHPPDLRRRGTAAEIVAGVTVSAAAYLAAILAVVITCLASQASGRAEAVRVVSVQLVFLVAFAMLGAFVGMLLTARLAPMVASLTAFSLVFAAVADVLPSRGVEFAGASTLLPLARHDPAVLLGQLALAASLVLLLGSLVISLLVRGTRRHVLLAASPGAVAVVAAQILVASTADVPRFTTEPASRVDYRCEGSNPEICLLADDVALMSAARTQTERNYAALGPGVPVPPRLVERAPDGATPIRGRVIEVSPDLTIGPASLSFYLVWNPERCLSGPTPPGRDAEAVYQFEQILLARARAGTASFLSPAQRRLAFAPQSEWVRVAAPVMRASAACRYEDVAAFDVLAFR